MIAILPSKDGDSCFMWSCFCFIKHTWFCGSGDKSHYDMTECIHNIIKSSLLHCFNYFPLYFARKILLFLVLCAILCFRPGAFCCTLLSAWRAINYLDVRGGYCKLIPFVESATEVLENTQTFKSICCNVGLFWGRMPLYGRREEHKLLALICLIVFISLASWWLQTAAFQEI